MGHHCYYCERIFDSKEKLYDHLEVHAKTEKEPKKRKEAKKRRKTENS